MPISRLSKTTIRPHPGNQGNRTMRRISWHWAWVVLAVSFFNLFVNYSVRLGYGLIMPEMIKDLSLSRSAAATIFNAFFLVYIALAPLSGYFSDRFGARRVISVCLLILGVGSFLMGRAEDLLSASIAFAVAGLGASGMWAPVVAVVQRWFAPNRRGMALGITNCGSSLGLASVGLFLPFVIYHFSWRYSWYFLGCAAFVMVVINGLFLRNSPADMNALPWGVKNHGSPEPQSDPFPKGALARILRQKNFWLIGLSYHFMAFSLFGVTTFMVDYAQNSLGMPQAQASLLGTIHGLSQLIGLLGIMPLSDYLGRRTTLIIANSMITASIIGLVIMGDSWPALCVIIGVFAVFYGVIFQPIRSLRRRLLSRKA